MNFIEEKILKRGNLDNLCFRFPPENSGFIHIGHAKSICLNFGLAKKYNAPCILRFDDTNPSNESDVFTKSIIEDIKWLGFTPSRITHASDYFEETYNYAVYLIKRGLAYMDNSTSEEIAILKGTPIKRGTDSPYRNRSIDENLDLFGRMKSGEFEEGSITLRAKIDMGSDNMILRDPILYRIINTPHHITGSKWSIYPMYDFAHPIGDYLEGISDSLCTLEFEVHRPLYNWVLNNLDLKGNLPEETEFARLNIDYAVLSKRKLKRLVDEGLVDGWDDPRMPTISGLRRRGYSPESIRNFCEKVGVTKVESVISHLLLEECLRDDLNKSANRLMGVMDPIRLSIVNWDGGYEMMEIDNNPEDESAGKRKVPFSGEVWIEREDFNLTPDKKYNRLKLGGEVRLKGAYIVEAFDCKLDDMGNVEVVYCNYDPLSRSGMTIDRKIKGTIHWVSVDHGISLEVRNYSELFNDICPDKSDDFISSINKNSLHKHSSIFEPSVEKCIVGKSVQMMRKGYYTLDKNNVFNKTVSLKETYK